MDAEYIALSTRMRELVRTRKFMKEIIDENILERLGVSPRSKVWEDNEAALKHAVADMTKLNPKPKHIGTKYHWF